MIITAGFDYASRNFTCGLDSSDAIKELGEDKWDAMSTLQRGRYLSALADLTAVIYAHEEGLIITGDVKGRIKKLQDKMASACPKD